jgi:predicted AAA+ superfamily ATPase
VFRLPPYYQNFNKRLVKRPKLYFYDSALVCQLLGIESKAHLAMHGSLGSIFEGFVLSEIKKALTAQGKPPTLYFWRSHAGDEIDGVLERGTGLLGLEIKSTMTFNNRLLANLERWQTIANTVQTDTALVYAGKESFQHQDISVIGWRDIGSQLGLS